MVLTWWSSFSPFTLFTPWPTWSWESSWPNSSALSRGSLLARLSGRPTLARTTSTTLKYFKKLLGIRKECIK